ncbi:MAG: hypothetical protein R2822_18010 [Spirosomataceae bacterium]
MLVRAWIAILLLTNYLLLAGMGCLTMPNDEHNPRLMVTINDEGQSYQACRYLRMDGLEAFMAESLASRYQQTPSDIPPHQILTIVHAIDRHYLPDLVQLPLFSQLKFAF